MEYSKQEAVEEKETIEIKRNTIEPGLPSEVDRGEKAFGKLLKMQNNVVLPLAILCFSLLVIINLWNTKAVKINRQEWTF